MILNRLSEELFFWAHDVWRHFHQSKSTASKYAYLSNRCGCTDSLLSVYPPCFVKGNPGPLLLLHLGRSKMQSKIYWILKIFSKTASEEGTLGLPVKGAFKAEKFCGLKTIESFSCWCCIWVGFFCLMALRNNDMINKKTFAFNPEFCLCFLRI